LGVERGANSPYPYTISMLRKTHMSFELWNVHGIKYIKR
jgi:hypothetical protein